MTDTGHEPELKPYRFVGYLKSKEPCEYCVAPTDRLYNERATGLDVVLDADCMANLSYRKASHV